MLQFTLVEYIMSEIQYNGWAATYFMSLAARGGQHTACSAPALMRGEVKVSYYRLKDFVNYCK